MRRIPPTQLVLPLLEELARAGGDARPKDIYDPIAERLGITDAERAETAHAADGKRHNLWERKIRWVRQTLVMQDLISAEHRGRWILTGRARHKLQFIRPGIIITFFTTELGTAYWARAEDAVAIVEPGSVQLLLTSPPYPCRKPYGGMPPDAWLDWMLRLGAQWRPMIAETGSIVLALGPVWNPGVPTVSTYIERITIAFEDKLGLHLCQRLEAHNPSRIPGPIPWVCTQRRRLTHATEPVLWMSPSPWNHADNRQVLRPYGPRMAKHIAQGGEPSHRHPSGLHFGRTSFARDNGGAIPTTLIRAPNSSSSDRYRQELRRRGIVQHPATMSLALPDLFIKLASKPGDLVYDAFGGSGTTALIAEQNQRRWLLTEQSAAYLDNARVRLNVAGIATHNHCAPAS